MCHVMRLGHKTEEDRIELAKRRAMAAGWEFIFEVVREVNALSRAHRRSLRRALKRRRETLGRVDQVRLDAETRPENKRSYHICGDQRSMKSGRIPGAHWARHKQAPGSGIRVPATGEAPC